MKNFLLLLSLVLLSCSSDERVTRYTDEDGVRHEVVHAGGGVGEHLAEAAVTGAVGGAAAGAGHRVADQAFRKADERRGGRPVRRPHVIKRRGK